jgi:two-component system response regulator PilR (NtrC family)
VPIVASILLVEDEPGIQLALRGLLRREGHELNLASSGDEAVRALVERPFDVVLTDLSLPGSLSGLDIVRHAARHRPGTPVILITAFGSERTAQEAMSSGAFDYVPKPFDNDTVRSVVRRALAASGANEG